jgi:hypothetical protein
MIWKKLEDKGKVYEVSEYGAVRYEKSNGEMYHYKKTVNDKGYVYYGHRTSHQWVAMAFLNHVPCGFKLVVHHIDANPSNNNVKNLEVITQSQNILKSKKEKSSIYPYVEFTGKDGRYKISMKAEGKQRYYGTFGNEEDAGRVSALLMQIFNK